MPSRSVGKSGGSAISPSMPVTGRLSSVESTSASRESMAANASLLLGRKPTGSSPAAGAAAGDPALKLAMDSRSNSFSMFCVKSKSKDEAESGGRPANDFLDEFRCAFSSVSMSPVSSYWSKAWCNSESSEAMSNSLSESFCSLLQSKHTSAAVSNCSTTWTHRPQYRNAPDLATGCEFVHKPELGRETASTFGFARRPGGRGRAVVAAHGLDHGRRRGRRKALRRVRGLKVRGHFEINGVHDLQKIRRWVGLVRGAVQLKALQREQIAIANGPVQCALADLRDVETRA